MILGIDPGFSGALAWYSPREKRIIAVCPMPVKAENIGGFEALVRDGGKVRPIVDTAKLAELVCKYPLNFVVVERVAASPQMGVTSAFRFGQGFGVIEGVLAAHGKQVRWVYPSAWKAGLGLSNNKKDSTVLATKLFPEWHNTFTESRASADLAEAALLAYYGIHFLGEVKQENIDKIFGSE